MPNAQRLQSGFIWILTLAIGLQAPISARGQTAPKRHLAIHAAKLIDGNTDTAMANPTVLIEGERISAIGQNLDIPSDVSVIDLRDATILPGLIDSHTHLLSNQNGAIGGYDVNLILEVSQMSTAKRALMGAALARQDLEAGITMPSSTNSTSMRFALKRRRFAMLRTCFATLAGSVTL